MFSNESTSKNALTQQELNLIHKNTVKILEEDGIKINNEKALQIFEDNNIKIKGKKVYISQTQLEELISEIPKHFTLQARNQDNNINIGNSTPIFGPPLGPPFIYENGNNRYGKYEDYLNLVKIFQQNKYIDIVGGDMIAPTDVEKNKRHKKMFYTSAVYSDKPLIGNGSGYQETKACLEMGEKIFGEENLKNNHYILKLVGASSPLEYNKKALHTLMNFAEHSQPLAIYSQSMAGMTSPLTLAGLLTLQNAEILLGAVLVQLINTSTPVIYGSTSSVTDMKSGNITVGNGYYSKIIKATSQIADYYNIPSMLAGGITDSKSLGYQAGYETMLNMQTAVNNNVDLIIFAAGSIDNYLGVSYKKLLDDFIMLESLNNSNSNIQIDENTIAKDIISEIGSGDNYLTHPHTLDNLESNLGKQNDIENYEEKINQLIEDYKKPSMDRKTDKRLKDLANKN